MSSALPLTRYRGATLLVGKLRVPKRCGLDECRKEIKKDEYVWRPIIENAVEGIHRGRRYCRVHFNGGVSYK